MIHNPCALLDRLLQEPGESAWLEFKVNNTDPREIGEYISALANAAMLAGRDRAFLVFGIEDKTKRRVGTNVRIGELRNGNENFTNWLSRLLEPHLVLDIVDFECGGLAFSIIGIDPAYERPVRFSGSEFIRIGENKRKLTDFPEHERRSGSASAVVALKAPWPKPMSRPIRFSPNSIPALYSI